MRPRKDVAEFAASAAAAAVVSVVDEPAAPLASAPTLETTASDVVVESVVASEAPKVEAAAPKKAAENKTSSRKNSGESRAAPLIDAASIAAGIKASNLTESEIQSLLDLLVQRQASVSEWRPANGGMDAAAILQRQLEDKEKQVQEIKTLNKSLTDKLDIMRKSHAQEKNRLVLMESQVQERSERQAQELRSLRLQVQQEQETHMSERAALQQKVAALEATTQNAAEQASHFKAVQENGAQFQQTAQKLQKEVQGELSNTIAKCKMAEASTAQAVEGVRREAEMSFQDAEANHQSQIRDAQAQLEDLAAKLAARDSTILELTSKMTETEESRALLEKKLNEALSCMPPTSERPA